MLSIATNTAEAVSAYVVGWAVSRGAPKPIATEFGWYVATGQAHESERHVPVRGRALDVLAVAETLRAPLACLKFAGQYADWRPLFGREWTDNPVGWFMTSTLTSTPNVPLRIGTAQVTQDGDLIAATIMLDGEVIASGRTGMAGEWCVPDRIRTSEQHRRQGLGTTVMRLLLNEAYKEGARRAVLDASEDGRALYEAMGWSMLSPQFGLTRTSVSV